MNDATVFSGSAGTAGARYPRPALGGQPRRSSRSPELRDQTGAGAGAARSGPNPAAAPRPHRRDGWHTTGQRRDAFIPAAWTCHSPTSTRSRPIPECSGYRLRHPAWHARAGGTSSSQVSSRDVVRSTFARRFGLAACNEMAPAGCHGIRPLPGDGRLCMRWVGAANIPKVEFLEASKTTPDHMGASPAANGKAFVG